ncbi:MAG: Mth938-like domain-containing protein [Candidatus Thermoplasmatota archaeon]
MEIEDYSFGKMKIDGKTYTSDLIIFPDKIKTKWYRKRGHRLSREDLNEVIDYKPNILIVGTGASGLMKIPDETKEYIEKQDIELKKDKTKKATWLYNQLKNKNKVVAAFHLTC